MPPTPLPATASVVAQIIVKGRLTAGGSTDTPCGNVFYYRQSVIGGAVNKVQLHTAFVNAVIAPLLLATNQAYTPTKSQIRFIDNAQDLVVEQAIAGVGARVLDSEPSVNAVVMVLRTAFRGRNARGFKHFGGTSEEDTTRDVLTGAGLARWQAVQAALKVSFLDAGGNGWTPWLFSPLGSSIKVNPTIVRGADINDVLLDLNVGTMRKRRSKTVR